jgi:hypothetical protein
MLRCASALAGTRETLEAGSLRPNAPLRVRFGRFPRDPGSRINVVWDEDYRSCFLRVAGADRTGREAEDPVGVIYRSCFQRVAGTDRTGREAEDPVGVIYGPASSEWREPTEADGEAGAFGRSYPSRAVIR